MRLTAELLRRRPSALAAPAAPTAVRYSTQLVVTVAAVSGATGYIFERSTDGTTWATIATQAGLSYADTGRTANTAYYYRVTATGVGTLKSAPSPVLSTSTTATASPPPDPTVAPTQAKVSSTSATVTATEVTGATGYAWQRSTTSGTAGFAAITASTGLSYDDTGLTAGTDYWYRYAATNPDGQSAGYSPALKVTTPALVAKPATPAQPTQTSVTATGAVLAVPPVTGATAYTWQRSATSATAGFATVGADTKETTFSDSGLTASTSYWYRVAAKNGGGTSAYSTAKQITTEAASSTKVQPISALKVREWGGGINLHTLSFWAEYENVDQVMAALGRLGVTWVRGKADPGSALSKNYAARLKKAGIGWCMTTANVSDRDGPPQMRARVREIGNSPDFRDNCIGLEGLNEPNNGAVPPTGYGYTDWAEWTADMQKVMYETATTEFPATLGKVTFVGPALHQLSVTQSGLATSATQHFKMLADLGIADYQDVAGMHAYPKGEKPLNKSSPTMQQRISYIENAFGKGYPIWLTETGYTTTKTAQSGNTTTVKAQGIYGPRAVLQYVRRLGVKMAWYELLDDVDSTGDNIQAHYGLMYATSATTITDKPIIGTVGALMKSLADPAGTAPYTPAQVDVTVTSGTADVSWELTATKAQSDAGIASVWLFRDVDVATGVTDLTISPVTVSVTDRKGKQTFTDVDARVKEVVLR